jgi:hypothetical protein
LLLAAAVALLGCSCGEMQQAARNVRSLTAPCPQQPECAADGKCSTSHYRTGDHYRRCYAGSVADCASSEVCHTEGRCGWDPAVSLECIVPGTLAPPGGPCRADAVCREIGMCEVFEGTCAATNDADCGASTGCLLRGRCSLYDSGGTSAGLCGATSDADCASSADCADYGRCARQQTPWGPTLACASKGGEVGR